MTGQSQKGIDIDFEDRGSELNALEREIRSAFSSISTVRHSEKKEIALPSDEKNFPSLDIDRKIEILIKEQKIQRFLSRYLKKYEEE